MFLLFQWGDFSGSMLVFGGLHLQLQSMIIFKTLDCSLIHCQCQQVSVIILTPTPTLTKKEYYIEHELVFSVSFFASFFFTKMWSYHWHSSHWHYQGFIMFHPSNSSKKPPFFFCRRFANSLILHPQQNQHGAGGKQNKQRHLWRSLRFDHFQQMFLHLEMNFKQTCVVCFFLKVHAFVNV